MKSKASEAASSPPPRRRRLAVGSPARGTRTGRPIMVALDMLGRRGTLRVLWELRSGALTFRALQDAAETNPALLNTRLKELREAALVEHDGSGYRLTGSGAELLVAMGPLARWAEEWGRDGEAPA